MKDLVKAKLDALGERTPFVVELGLALAVGGGITAVCYGIALAVIGYVNLIAFLAGG